MNNMSPAVSNNYRILVVDNEMAVRKTIGAAFSRDGYDVAYAVDGFETGSF